MRYIREKTLLFAPGSNAAEISFAEVKGFATKIPYFSLRHSVRPGITGWAQVNYQYGTSADDPVEKIQHALFYIKNLSPLLDFHILLKTVKVVLWGRGGEVI